MAIKVLGIKCLPLHHTGRGCSSCRAFFRRSVQNKAYEKFVCKNQQTRLQFCIIDSKSWKSCKYCRYNKCLESGMQPSFVLNEVERKIRHEKRTAKYHIKIDDIQGAGVWFNSGKIWCTSALSCSFLYHFKIIKSIGIWKKLISMSNG